MRKKMESLAKRLDPKVMYLTETPMPEDAQAHHGCRYFLVWTDTKSIYQAFSNQQECIDGLEMLIADGGANVGPIFIQVVPPEKEAAI